MASETHYPGVWIVVPAFNEAAVIGEVIADVRSVFDHVVCVDDGSTDGTGEIARRAGAHLVRHPINLGQGAAIQTGVEYARKQPGAQVFATFDADGQHRVKDVVAMIDRLARVTSTSSSGPGSAGGSRQPAAVCEAHGAADRRAVEPARSPARPDRHQQRAAGIQQEGRRRLESSP